MDALLVSIDALKDRIFSKDCGPSPADCEAWRRWEHNGAAKSERRRREHKPTLASVAKQASKAGIAVARYEVEPDGKIVVVPGKPEADQTNDLDKWMAKRHAH
jgi:hypothetical protein